MLLFFFTKRALRVVDHLFLQHDLLKSTVIASTKWLLYIAFMKTIYVDTSVFGGKFDEEFEYWTKKFFDKVIANNVKLLKSDVVDDELAGSPKFVMDFVDSIPNQIIQQTDLSEEGVWLAEQYIKEEVVGKASRADCFHIAIATIHKVDLLVSWNFKHIVNIERIHGYNAVNLKNGFQTLEIRNPREAFDYEDNH